MDHQRIITNKSQKFIDNIGEQRFISQKRGGQTMHIDRFLRHVPFRVDIEVQAAPGRQMMHQFKRTNLDEAVAAAWV